MSMLERARAPPDGVNNACAREHRADRLVAAAESLGDGLDIRRDALLLPRMQCAGAPHAAHDLVEDHQCAMAIADVSDGAEVTLRRRPASGGGPHSPLPA